jgi:hypothetical protein
MCSMSLRNRIINTMKEIEHVVNTQNMEHSLTNNEPHVEDYDMDCVRRAGSSSMQ